MGGDNSKERTQLYQSNFQLSKELNNLQQQLETQKRHYVDQLHLQQRQLKTLKEQHATQMYWLQVYAVAGVTLVAAVSAVSWF